MKKNIKEYKEIVDIVADIQDYLESKIECIGYDIERYKGYEDNEENEYYQEHIKESESKINTINKIIDNLEKLL